MTTAREVRLYHRLQLAAHSAMKHADRQMKAAVDMTTAQVSVLAVVSRGGEVAQRTVAAELGINESAVTPMVRRLEVLGHLTRTADARDRRARLLKLTPQGERALTVAGTAFAEVNKAIEDELTPAEIRRTADVLTRLLAAFDAPRAPPRRERL